MAQERCPSADLLEAFANGLEKNSAIGHHIQTCPMCRENVAALIDDAATVNELRVASASEVSSKLRGRLLHVCRQALMDAGQ